MDEASGLVLFHEPEGDDRAEAFKLGNRGDSSFTKPLAALGTEVAQGFDGEFSGHRLATTVSETSVDRPPKPYCRAICRPCQNTPAN